MRAFVGIDAGTTGCTVMIFDEGGNALGHGYQEYPCVSPKPGWSEQDVYAVWDGICMASRQATREASLPDEAYHSIGFSSQRGTFICLDEDMKPLGNSIVWNCARAPEYQEILGREISAEDYQDHTGMQLSPLWAAAKIAWLRDNDKERFAKTRWFANGQEYFLMLLGAEDWATDPASLTLNGMMEIRKLDWSDRILSIIGIDRNRVPPVGIPSGSVGKVSAKAAAETGFPVGAILCRGAGDQQCAAMGAGVIRQGMAEFTVGTSGVMVAHLDSLDRIKGKNLWWGGHGVPNAWNIEGAAFSLGADLKWWRDTLGFEEIEIAEREGRSPFSVMVDRALNAPAGANGLMFHSFLSSQVTPYYDAYSRGAFLGIGNGHTRIDLLRALLEGCSHEMRMVVDSFQSDIDGGITDFRLTGGGTKSEGFIRIMTDVIGMPTKVTRERECTVLGAAILGAYGSGGFASLEEAVDAMVVVEAEMEPDPKLKDLYDEQHGVYRGFYEAMANAGQYQNLAEFAARYA